MCIHGQYCRVALKTANVSRFCLKRYFYELVQQCFAHDVSGTELAEISGLTEHISAQELETFRLFREATGGLYKFEYTVSSEIDAISFYASSQCWAYHGY